MKSKYSNSSAVVRHLRSVMARGEHRHAPRRSCAGYQNGNGGGYEVIGEVRRKSKHFEEESAAFEEFHIELDGDVRKTKPVSPDDHRWRSEIEEAWASRSDEPAQRT